MLILQGGKLMNEGLDDEAMFAVYEGVRYPRNNGRAVHHFLPDPACPSMVRIIPGTLITTYFREF